MCVSNLFNQGSKNGLFGLIPFLGQKAMSSSADATPTPPAPTPLPAPSPLPTVSSSQSSMQDNQSVVRNRLRYGLASTVKTGPQGILNQSQSTGKTTLG